jgi:hypothetical protein
MYGQDAVCSSYNGLSPASIEVVKGSVEALDGLFMRFEEIRLIRAVDEPTKPHTDKAYTQTAVVESVEESMDGWNEFMVSLSVSDALLAAHSIEGAVANLNGDTAGEAVLLSELSGKLFGHGGQDASDGVVVDGVAFESLLGADGFGFVVGLHRGGIYCIGFLPDVESIATEGTFYQLWWHLLKGGYTAYSEFVKGRLDLSAYTGNTLHWQRCEK